MKFPDLNPQQKLAVQAPDKPLLIVAGAGTGKTRTLTSRLLHLVDRGIPAHHIIAITFTNKAAREMGDRVATMTVDNDDDKNSNRSHSHRYSHGKLPFIGTFHSLGAKILRSEARHLGRTSNFVIFDDGDSLQLIKKIMNTPHNSVMWGMKAFGGETKRGSYDRGPVYFAQKVSRIKNGVIDPPHNGFMSGANMSKLEHSNKENIFALEVLEHYEQELLRQNAFDFDDLIGKVGAIFRKHPEVLEKYRKRFRYVLVDEYQDLNNCQYELIRLLVGDSARISVVGDSQQMIYSFRGSNFNIFLDFENDWPDANIVVLEENYRSTANIIKSASALMQNNNNQSGSLRMKTLWTKNEEGSLVKIVEAEDDDMEAEWIAEQIANGIGHRADSKGQRVNSHMPSTAVLYRTNAQSRAIEQALIERGIPYKIFGGLRFYERKEIKDIVAALRLVQNPKDEVSRERLEKNLSKGRFLNFQKFLNDNKNSSPFELVSTFLERTGYLELLQKNFSNSEDRKENIAELLNFASGFTELAPFLEQIALLQPADDLANSKRQMAYSEERKAKNYMPSAISHRPLINLMTIHLAKGLEFDAVFVAGCIEGILPHNRSLGSEAELEEERRLMYVAMTRAKKELFLSFYDIPSRFLGELPTDSIEFESLIDSGRTLDDEERYIVLS